MILRMFFTLRINREPNSYAEFSYKYEFMCFSSHISHKSSIVNRSSHGYKITIIQAYSQEQLMSAKLHGSSHSVLLP